MNVWGLCEGSKFIKNLSIEPWRVVEAQNVLSSRDLVDSIEEHDLLEDLIEDSKPQIEKEAHYLIFTPFRYPPLKYGSRFGRTFESSLWYGSLELETAFAEVAYYRFMFLTDTVADLGDLELTMTAFTAFLTTKRGIDLTDHPFNKYSEQISSKDSYQYSQLLGTSMRQEQIEAFVFSSARNKKDAKNIGIFTSSVFQKKANKHITNFQNWQCFGNRDVIEFIRIGVLGKHRYSFEKNYFI